MNLLDHIAHALNRRSVDLTELRDLDLDAQDAVQRLANDRSVLTAILREPSTSQADAVALSRRVEQIGAEVGKLLSARVRVAAREGLLRRNRGTRAFNEVAIDWTESRSGTAPR